MPKCFPPNEFQSRERIIIFSEWVAVLVSRERERERESFAVEEKFVDIIFVTFALYKLLL